MTEPGTPARLRFRSRGDHRRRGCATVNEYGVEGDDVTTLEDVVEALSDPGFYPHGPDSVEVRRTHASVAFLAGDEVYKLKKPVNFGFLDYSTLAQRRRMCLLEVTLNQRLAPAVYLGVVGVTMGAAGLQLGGVGTVVEHLVHMRRLPDAAALSARLAADDVGEAEVREVARKVAAFHRQAERSGLINTFGQPHVVISNVNENFQQTRRFVGTTITTAAYTEIVTYASAFLMANRAVIQARVDAGQVCDGHGDLRCEHVYLAEALQIIDCIEFNDRLRYGDVAADFGFLAMDLEAYGAPDLAAALVDEYQTATAADLAPVLDFYCCYRAFIRGKVASLRLDDPDLEADARHAARREAQRYFQLARRIARGARRPSLIITSGVSGTGKSTLARELELVLATPRYEADTVRKMLAGVEPSSRQSTELGQGIYGPEMSQRTYAHLLEQAELQLARGRSVILDATYQRRKHRLAARAVAERSGAAFYVVHCDADDALVRERILRREDDPERTSDAGLEIYLAQRKHFEPVDELPAGEVVTVDTALSIEDQLAFVLDRL